jgi:hypothetical protein
MMSTRQLTGVIAQVTKAGHLLPGLGDQPRRLFPTKHLGMDFNLSTLNTFTSFVTCKQTYIHEF